MSFFIKTVEVSGAIPMADALLCLDCEMVYDMRQHRSCPACSSHRGASVSGFLNREAR